MKDWERDNVQPGNSVWTSDGQELGSVIAVDETEITIRKKGLMGGELTVPMTAVEEVESGRVELSMTKEEAEAAASRV